MLPALSAVLVAASCLTVPPDSTGIRTFDGAGLAASASHPAPRMNLPLPEGGQIQLLLERTDPLAPGAMVVSATRTTRGVVQKPLATNLRCYTGRVEGHDEARVFLAEADGFIGGFVEFKGDARRTLWISSGPRGRGLPTVVFDPSRVDPALLPSGDDFCRSDELAAPAVPRPTLRGDSGLEDGPQPCREVLLAIDTDIEYTANLFGGNQAAAAAYAIALTAATSEIYTNDLDARLRVSYIRLWTGDDPWTMGNTVDQLFEYRDYWVANEGAVQRDLGHFLSGRGLGGGVAWLPGLCGGEYAFGLSANLGGYFPYPLVDHSGANWDVMVFAHELGHNFGSPHTHSYQPPLDGCGNGDCSDAYNGTIMSYCHTCPGGLTNVSLHFHPGNVATMLDFLASIPCDFSDETAGAFAADDYVTAPAGESVTVSPLLNDLRMNCGEISLAAYPDATAHGAPIVLAPGLPGEPPILSVDVPADASEDDWFEYTISDALGATATATVHLDVLALLPAVPVSGTSPGAAVDYFATGDLVVLPDFTTLRPSSSDIVASVDFPSTGGAFATSGLADYVAAVFTGWVDVPSSGQWTFFSESDDGSKLFVDGQLVVANDGLHGMVEKSGTVAVAGGKHLVRVEFFERTGGAGQIVRLQGPGFPKAVVPPALWSHGGAVGADLDGDGDVNGSDLAILLGAWDTRGPVGDLDLDGVVGGADLAILLGGWTG